jgi:hypothetical protein
MVKILKSLSSAETRRSGLWEIKPVEGQRGEPCAQIPELLECKDRPTRQDADSKLIGKNLKSVDVNS